MASVLTHRAPRPWAWADAADAAAHRSWRQTGLGLLRIGFGLVYAVDAWFKWQPAFLGNVAGYLTGAMHGQPAAIRAWIGLWAGLVGAAPHAFGYAVALGETAVAIGLVLGLLSNLTCGVGALLALMIWSTAEGFGGLYHAGATDVGTAIIYALVFAGLFLAQAGRHLGLDRRLAPLLGRWDILASGPAEPHAEA